MLFTQTGSCVRESGAAPLSAGIFMKPTLILIGLSHNTAHWCPLPDSMSECPQTKFTCENVVYNVPDYCFTLTCLSKSYIYVWIPYKYKLPVRTKYFKAWKWLKNQMLFTEDRTEDKHTWGWEFRFLELPGTKTPLEYGISAAHKAFLKQK